MGAPQHVTAGVCQPSEPDLDLSPGVGRVCVVSVRWRLPKSVWVFGHMPPCVGPTSAPTL